MSTAVLISGQMRTFARCYPTQRWQVFRHYQRNARSICCNAEPHFFVSCVDDENAHTAELLRQHYKNVHIERYQDPVLSEIPQPLGAHAPYANATSHDKLLLQHWSNKRVWDFMVKETKSPLPFRTIIRIRPDQFFHRFQKPLKPHTNECYTPWWGKFGGVNDRFGIMGAHAAYLYFNTWDNIDQLLEMGCPFHPETLVMESMRLGEVDIIPKLMASFSTIRVDGQQRWPEIAMEDVAELYA